MKRIALCLLLMCSVALWSADDKKTEKTTKTTTTTTAKSSATEDAIKKMERELWDAWKNHDNKPFEQYLADDALVLDDPAQGFQEKKAMLSKMNASNQCDVKSYSFGDEHFIWIDKDAAIYTYNATVDATCGGQKIPDKVSASSVWVKRGSKWVGQLHQETAAMPPMAGEKKGE